MRDLSSPTRDQTHTPCKGSMEFLTTGLPRKSLKFFKFLNCVLISCRRTSSSPLNSCVYFQKNKDIIVHSSIQFLTQTISVYILLLATDFIAISLDVPIMSLIVKENPELCFTFSCVVSLVSYSGSVLLYFFLFHDHISKGAGQSVCGISLMWALPDASFHGYFQKSLVGRVPPGVSLSLCSWWHQSRSFG